MRQPTTSLAILLASGLFSSFGYAAPQGTAPSNYKLNQRTPQIDTLVQPITQVDPLPELQEINNNEKNQRRHIEARSRQKRTPAPVLGDILQGAADVPVDVPIPSTAEEAAQRAAEVAAKSAKKAADAAGSLIKKRKPAPAPGLGDIVEAAADAISVQDKIKELAAAQQAADIAAKAAKKAADNAKSFVKREPAPAPILGDIAEAVVEVASDSVEAQNDVAEAIAIQQAAETAVKIGKTAAENAKDPL